MIATGDELVEAGRASQPGQVVDANSHALAAAAAEAGAHAYRIGICDDDPEALRGVLEDQFGRADLDHHHRRHRHRPGRHGAADPRPGRVGRVHRGVRCPRATSLGYGTLARCRPGADGVPGDLPARRPGRGADRLRGAGPAGDPEARRGGAGVPAQRAGAPAGDGQLAAGPAGVPAGRTSPSVAAAVTPSQPLPGGPYTLSGLAAANGLIVLGERVGNAPAGSTVDVLMLDRRR